MQPLSIQSYHAKHEGGTKFYSVWTIFGRTRAVVVFQWGKNTAYMRGKAMGGETKIEAYSAFDIAANVGTTQMRAKRKRGYNQFAKDWSTEHKTTKELDDEVMRLFGKEKGLRILLELDEKTDDMAATDAARKQDLKAYKEPEPERGDVWGSW